MYYVLVTLYIFTCLFLLVVVLLQQGKGGDIAAAFGGASSQTAFGARAGATVLSRATTILGALFMIGAFALTIYSRSGGGSVVGGIDAPAATQEAPALPTGGALPAPTTPPAGGGSTPGPEGTSPAGTTPAPGTTTPPAGSGSAPAGSGSTPPAGTPPASGGSGS